MEKTIIHHLHFYQPRRNDDWTSKINEECYKPLSHKGVFSHISFNIGPTLIDWFVKNDPITLMKIVESDNGQAIAQPYNHRIMPLIRYDEDLKTQIIWGKKYFKAFFGREPEGMWLPETATSKRVCRKLVEEGIKYTIGAPWQMKDVSNFDEPYFVDLGDNLKIIYFFYHPISGKVAFNEEFISGKKFLDNVDLTLDYFSAFTSKLLFLAYDGETFGHHHKFADMWLSYFPICVDSRTDFKMLTLNDYLNNFEVKSKGDFFDFSSWSCHCGGLKRWITGCSCAGGKMDYQEPMLRAFEYLEDKVHEIFVEESTGYFKNIWFARNDYIDLRIGVMKNEDFFRQHLKHNISCFKEEFLRTLLLSEYFVQLSFTSCGWFFPEMSIQAKQNIFDAYTAAKLVDNILKTDLVSNLFDRLSVTEELSDYCNFLKET